MFSEKFYEVLKHEGVVSITSWSEGNVHVSNTWNSYLVIKDDNKILIPAAGMKKTEENVAKNNKVILTLGSREVMGNFSMGTGFFIEGTVNYLDSGADFNMMLEKFPFLNRVIEVTVTNAKQTL